MEEDNVILTPPVARELRRFLDICAHLTPNSLSIFLSLNRSSADQETTTHPSSSSSPSSAPSPLPDLLSLPIDTDVDLDTIAIIYILQCTRLREQAGKGELPVAVGDWLKL